LAEGVLLISERDIRRHGPGNLLRVCWRQWRAERALRRRGVHFRATDPDVVAGAYAAMTEAEFEAINGRQDWANWRTIPRALSGHVPDRPVQVLDLGCGTGSSTQVLAFYCPAGSRVIGYEIAAPLLIYARRRSYRQRAGGLADVDFVCQGLTEPLRLPGGGLIPERSIDVVNASGVVGHHLGADTVGSLVCELGRVLRTAGIASLDVGPSLSEERLTRIMEQAGFRRLGRYRSWFGDPTGQVVLAKM
jgi:SAM-dependent methyltransferase